MKTIGQSITKLLALTLLLTMTFSCEQINRNKLEKVIDEMNRECPQEMEGMGTFLGGELKGDMVIFKYKFTKENFELVKEGAKTRSKEENAEIMAMDFVSREKEQGSFAKTIKQIIDAGCGLTLQYTGEDDNDKVSIEITKEHFLKAKEKYATATPQELAMKAIEDEVKRTKAKLPAKVDEITMMTGYDLQDGYIVYTYEVDDTKFDFKVLEARKDVLRKEMFSDAELSEQAISAAFSNYVKAGVGLKYLYKSKTTDRSFEIKFETNELPRANQTSSKVRMNRINR